MGAKRIQVGLSTASVYPQNTEAAFRYAAELGYDGIELMVWAESVSQDVDAVAALSREYSMPVQAIHAPCLLISQRVWGSDPVTKLARSVEAAEKLDSATVVVHPPFRWQRKYSDGFADQVAELESNSHVVVAVENMFPMRADRFFGRKEKSAQRLERRGGPGAALSAFSPSYDPTDVGHGHYTLDLSHTATAGSDALEMLDRMGEGIAHLHLADGRGASVDEHLIPGHGSQPCVEVCTELVRRGFEGQAVIEINTQNARTVPERSSMLGQALQFARAHLS
ncbi:MULTISPECIES: sugar phosphate isomerase/epimerase family protein [Rhodococcus]|uniref:Sugar phosphate isomerase/epimerase n=3 Tax=Rhodococcus TaxID=1827 RepID=A0ABU4AY32_9NOCA|nr:MULTISPECIES: sugar phosphate isomerase/epimerase [Rhodococcus]MDI9928573.1 sugar phosphate isomerase/epimerase [Rhodococcus sp. IEGM 1341]MDV6231135.1 sugar phosphate isomerase/epimerase [Rhodococcus cercidiphylli]MDV6304038.1 sugar phosphate isomerase/epimerase [Rhodococcus cerastii]MDV8056744.1 sugar phosphate isomerase/epimerase [Rhodococcus sp. IEGM 1343]MDV8076633.1 sugar phosphate isomerase/epimerase [Rhodococcus sp. IEGM 1370]